MWGLDQVHRSRFSDMINHDFKIQYQRVTRGQIHPMCGTAGKILRRDPIDELTGPQSAQARWIDLSRKFWVSQFLMTYLEIV